MTFPTLTGSLKHDSKHSRWKQHCPTEMVTSTSDLMLKKKKKISGKKLPLSTRFLQKRGGTNFEEGIFCNLMIWATKTNDINLDLANKTNSGCCVDSYLGDDLWITIIAKGKENLEFTAGSPSLCDILPNSAPTHSANTLVKQKWYHSFHCINFPHAKLWGRYFLHSQPVMCSFSQRKDRNSDALSFVV